MALWMQFLSVCNWNDVDLWHSFLEESESTLQSRLTHLDKRDPIRRKVAENSNREQAKYACGFTRDDGSLYMWGQYRDIDVDFTLIHQNWIGCGPFAQKFWWSVPDEFADDQMKTVMKLFRAGIRRFAPFYAFVDYDYWVASRYPGPGRSTMKESYVALRGSHISRRHIHDSLAKSC